MAALVDLSKLVCERKKIIRFLILVVLAIFWKNLIYFSEVWLFFSEKLLLLFFWGFSFHSKPGRFFGKKYLFSEVFFFKKNWPYFSKISINFSEAQLFIIIRFFFKGFNYFSWIVEKPDMVLIRVNLGYYGIRKTRQ